jgi:hypothetical protein
VVDLRALLVTGSTYTPTDHASAIFFLPLHHGMIYSLLSSLLSR